MANTHKYKLRAYISRANGPPDLPFTDHLGVRAIDDVLGCDFVSFHDVVESVEGQVCNIE